MLDIACNECGSQPECIKGICVTGNIHLYNKLLDEECVVNYKVRGEPPIENCIKGCIHGDLEDGKCKCQGDYVGPSCNQLPYKFTFSYDTSQLSLNPHIIKGSDDIDSLKNYNEFYAKNSLLVYVANKIRTCI